MIKYSFIISTHTVNDTAAEARSQGINIHDVDIICPGQSRPYDKYDSVEGKGLQNHFPPFHHSKILQEDDNTVLLWNITIISDRCRRSCAAVTPVNYERDLENATCVSATDINLSEKLTNRALLTPTLVNVNDNSLITWLLTPASSSSPASSPSVSARVAYVNIYIT